MDIVERVDALRDHDGGGLCVLAVDGKGELAGEASRTLGLRLPSDAHVPRRPGAAVYEDQISLALVVLAEGRQQHLLRLYTRSDGMLVVGDAAALDVVRPAVAAASADAWSCLVDIVMAVARRCEDVLDEIDDDCQDFEAQATGYSSSPQRRAMGRLRAELFRIGETQAAQQHLLSADEEVAQALKHGHRRLIARAAAAFGANHSMTTRLYAMLGDVLNAQDSVVSERLTLVATIFLPLTLATGFFGMNFQWMLDQLKDLPTFAVFGLTVPAILTVVTLVLIRRLTRSS